MSGRRNWAVTAGFVLAVSLIAASFTAIFCGQYYSRAQFQMLGEVCREILQQQPEAEGAVTAALKAYRERGQEKPEAEGAVAAALKTYREQGQEKPETERTITAALEAYPEKGQNILLAYGYQEDDFFPANGWRGLLPVTAGFLAGTALFILTLSYRRRKETARIQSLTDYLEQVNTGGSGLLFSAEEDMFSGLQDEIYKTVTALYQTRDAAMRARDNFAENLSNIAHQIKTPITSISLSIQMLKNHPAPGHLEQIRQQLSRLTRLEEALLLLSRIDAGTLPLKKEKVDVFTLLTLAGDNLQELFDKAQVELDIPEAGEIPVAADLEWTMEAVMNLLKNCLEHTSPGGKVSCAYEQNPLYTWIRIWDSGSGFAREDLPRLFERFYRGRGAGSGGIGIGLSLAKEIIERQNGTISARNLAEGGACFEIRMYSH